MSSHWKSAVEHSLRATESNLRALSGGAPVPDTGSEPDLGRPYSTQGPASTHRFLRPSSPRNARAGSSGGSFEFSTRSGPGINKQKENRGPAEDPDARSRVGIVESQVQLERVAREEAFRSLRSNMELELGELRCVIDQVRQENLHLRQSVIDLEQLAMRKGGFFPGGEPSSTSSSSTEDERHTLLRLTDRVERVERAIADNSRASETQLERQQALVSDMLQGKMAVEVERVRSVARDAAKASVDELLRKQAASLHSSFAEQLRETQESQQSVMETVERMSLNLSTQREEWNRTLATLEDRVGKASADRRFDAVKFTEEAQEKISVLVQDENRRVEETCAALRQEVTAILRKSSIEALDIEKRINHSMTQRLETVSLQTIGKDDVHRMLRQEMSTIETEIASLHGGLTNLRQGYETIRKEVVKVAGSSTFLQNAETELIGLQEKNRRLEEDQVKFWSKFEELAQKIKLVQTEVRTSKDSYGDFGEEIAQLKSQFTELRESSRRTETELSNKVDAAGKTVSRLEPKINSLEKNIVEERENTEKSLGEHNEALSRVQKVCGEITSRAQELERVEREKHSSLSRNLQELTQTVTSHEEKLEYTRTTVEPILESILEKIAAATKRAKDETDRVRVDSEQRSKTLEENFQSSVEQHFDRAVSLIQSAEKRVASSISTTRMELQDRLISVEEKVTETSKNVMIFTSEMKHAKSLIEKSDRTVAEISQKRNEDSEHHTAAVEKHIAELSQLVHAKMAAMQKRTEAAEKSIEQTRDHVDACVEHTERLAIEAAATLEKAKVAHPVPQHSPSAGGGGGASQTQVAELQASVAHIQQRSGVLEERVLQLETTSSSVKHRLTDVEQREEKLRQSFLAADENRTNASQEKKMQETAELVAKRVLVKDVNELISTKLVEHNTKIIKEVHSITEAVKEQHRLKAEDHPRPQQAFEDSQQLAESSQIMTILESRVLQCEEAIGNLDDEFKKSVHPLQDEVSLIRSQIQDAVYSANGLFQRWHQQRASGTSGTSSSEQAISSDEMQCETLAETLDELGNHMDSTHHSLMGNLTRLVEVVRRVKFESNELDERLRHAIGKLCVHIQWIASHLNINMEMDDMVNDVWEHEEESAAGTASSSER